MKTNDLVTGYRFQFDIYTGKKKNREGGLGENVVMQLSRSLIGTNVRLYFENFFTTPFLIFKFKEDQIYSCGTACQNRKGMHKFYLRIFFSLMDISYVKAIIVYTKYMQDKYPHSARLKTLKNFKHDVVMYLIGEFSSRKRARSSSTVVSKSNSVILFVNHRINCKSFLIRKKIILFP